MQTAGGASEWKWRSKGRRQKKEKREDFFFFFLLYSKGAAEPLHFIGSSSRVGSGLCTSGGSLKAEANARARTEHRQSQRGSRKCHCRTGEKARHGPSAFHFISFFSQTAKLLPAKRESTTKGAARLTSALRIRPHPRWSH